MKKFTIYPSTVLTRNSNQLFTLIDDEVVMLHIENEEYLNLNPQASYIWQKLETPLTFDELIEMLLGTYDIERSACIEDTLAFIKDFAEKNIIQIKHV